MLHQAVGYINEIVSGVFVDGKTLFEHHQQRLSHLHLSPFMVMENHTVFWTLFKSPRPSAAVYFKLPKMALFQAELEYTRVINENIGIEKHIKRQEMRVSRMSAVRLSLAKDHRRASLMAPEKIRLEGNTNEIGHFTYLK